MASSISDFSAHRKNYSYCYVYGISNVGHWEIKTQQIFVIGVLIPMDYEDYYYEFRSRYYDACSEVNNYENRANELRSQRQRKIIYQSAQIRFKKTSKSVVRAKCSFKKRLHTSR